MRATSLLMMLVLAACGPDLQDAESAVVAAMPAGADLQFRRVSPAASEGEVCGEVRVVRSAVYLHPDWRPFWVSRDGTVNWLQFDRSLTLDLVRLHDRIRSAETAEQLRDYGEMRDRLQDRVVEQAAAVEVYAIRCGIDGTDRLAM